MASIQHPIIKKRQKHYRPCEIIFVGLAVTVFDPPIVRPYLDLAKEEYDRETKKGVAEIRRISGAEAD